jgi:hypothetical protein
MPMSAFSPTRTLPGLALNFTSPGRHLAQPTFAGGGDAPIMEVAVPRTWAI